MWFYETFISGICTPRHTHTYTNTHIHKHARARGLALVWEVRCSMGSVGQVPLPTVLYRPNLLSSAIVPPKPLSPSLEPISFLSSSGRLGSGNLGPSTCLFLFCGLSSFLSHISQVLPSSLGSLNQAPSAAWGPGQPPEAEQGSWCSRRELLS